MQPNRLNALQNSLSWIDDLIRAAVSRAHNAGLDPTDALRGLVITDEEVSLHLITSSMEGLWQGEEIFPQLDGLTFTDDDPLGHMADIFGLNQLDCHILLVCLAPELDRRYERLYAYLQDDVSQRRPTVNLLVNLLGGDVNERFAVWDRLKPHMPLRTHRLIEVSGESQNHPTFLAHQLKLDNRVLGFLMGDDHVDARLKTSVVVRPAGKAQENIAPASNTLRAALQHNTKEPPIVHMQGMPGAGREAAALSACAEIGVPLTTIRMSELKELEGGIEANWPLAIRESYLARSVLLIHEWELCLKTEDMQAPADLWQSVLNYPGVVFLCSRETFEPLDEGRTRRLIRVKFELPTYDFRYAAWRDALANHGVFLGNEDIVELASKFKLTDVQIKRAVNTASDLAASRGEQLTTVDLVAGAQAHSSLKLGRLAKRIVPRYTWTDLILPPDRVQVLREICSRIRFAHVINESWGFSHRVSAAPGVTALFAGDSGTGKTLAAEVIAQDLGLLLYKIDLSAVVSKYIGETEKNLSVIFDEAHQSNAVLFFDEADALFGKRSEVKDAHDRYANLEVAYLLQQLEVYEGVAILATNLRQNLDEAFTRRLSFLVDFPFPEREYREKLWGSHFPPEAPIGRDVDLHELSDRFALAGGNIRNAAIASAYLAAADGQEITMAHIRHAIRREHQKMGRLIEDDY